MEYAILAVVVVVCLAIGFLTGWRFRLPQVVEEALNVLPFTNHQHDLHVRGKRNGRVRLYCVVPGCRHEQYADEGRG